MEPFSVLETETQVPLLIWHWQKAGRSWLLQCPAAWEWGALLSCWEEPHVVYGARIGPSSKGGSCGKQHSQYWVLDPTQLPCLKAVQQGSGASAEAVRWGREGGRKVARLKVVNLFGLKKNTEKVDITEIHKTSKTSGNWKDWKPLTDSVNCPEVRI